MLKKSYQRYEIVTLIWGDTENEDKNTMGCSAWRI